MSEWKEIEGYPDYQVSDDGRVKSFKNGKERILKGCNNGDGHLRINLLYNGKQKSKLVHRLMAEAFIPNPDNLPFVRHLNDIPDDNRLENLAWGTPKDNTNDSIKNGSHVCCDEEYMNKLRLKDAERTRKPVIAIKENLRIHFNSMQEAAEKLNLDVSHISSCVKGTRKSTGGYKFEKE